MAQTALKTTYKDYVPPTEGRKYRITQLEDGLCTIEDVTDYLQQGDTFGAEDINEVNRVVNDACADFSMEEDEMPYRWADGKIVYRMGLILTPEAFSVEETSLGIAGEESGKTATMRILTKTNEMSQAKEFLPMTTACLIKPDGGFRLLNANRPELSNYETGWRIDRANDAWTLVVSIGELLLSDIQKIEFVFYYTK